MELTTLENQLPLRAYPKDKLDNVFDNQFILWLSDLLSLTDELSAKRLYLAVEPIKTACWSMGFAEIKKMFELYADGKLSIAPIPNYFDRILLGKIVQSYKENLKSVNNVKKIDESEYKDLIDVQDCLDHFESFKTNGKLNKNAYWIYAYLYDFKKVKSFIDFADGIKVQTWDRFKHLDKKTDDKIEDSKTEILRLFFERLVQTNIELKPLI